MKSEIPNISGYWNNIVVSGFGIGGAFGSEYYNENNMSFNTGQYRRHHMGININASRCSDRYGSYTEVNPLYNSCKYIIRY